MTRSVHPSARIGLWVGTVLGCAFMVVAPIAGADSTLPQAGSESASDTVDAFQSSGYDVRINYPQGHPNVPLSECKVTAIRDFNGPMASIMMLSPVDIDVACPNAK